MVNKLLFDPGKCEIDAIQINPTKVKCSQRKLEEENFTQFPNYCLEPGIEPNKYYKNPGMFETFSKANKLQRLKDVVDSDTNSYNSGSEEEYVKKITTLAKTVNKVLSESDQDTEPEEDTRN